MNRQMLLESLDQLGETLKQLGEDYVAITFRRGDSLLPGDRFIVSVQLDGAGPLDRHITTSNARPSAAFVRAMADRSDKEQELAFRAEVEAEVRARIEKAAA